MKQNGSYSNANIQILYGFIENTMIILPVENFKDHYHGNTGRMRQFLWEMMDGYEPSHPIWNNFVAGFIDLYNCLIVSKSPNEYHETQQLLLTHFNDMGIVGKFVESDSCFRGGIYGIDKTIIPLCEFNLMGDSVSVKATNPEEWFLLKCKYPDIIRVY